MDLLLPVALVLLLCCSAFFSGSETALMSLNAVRLRWMRSEGHDTRNITAFLSDPARVLATILIGNLLANLTASTIATSLAIYWWGGAGVGIVIAIMSTFLLIFGEITPKILAVKNVDRVARWTTPILQIFATITTPVRLPLMGISNRFLQWSVGSDTTPSTSVTEEDLITLVNIGHEQGDMNQFENRMIQAVLRYTDMLVSSVMVPRVDMLAVSTAMSQKDVHRFLIKTRHSKIPVYHESLDTIHGILYAKQALLQPNQSYHKLLVPPFYVPETARLHQVFHQMREQQRRMAIIVDEFGGTVGLVTMEDLVEEVFGEIYDEFEHPDRTIHRIRPRVYRVPGTASVYEINAMLHLQLPETEYDTVAGLVIGMLERLPFSGETIRVEGALLRAEQIRDNRIQSLILTVTH
jgi:putative hemolysin